VAYGWATTHSTLSSGSKRGGCVGFLNSPRGKQVKERSIGKEKKLCGPRLQKKNVEKYIVWVNSFLRGLKIRERKELVLKEKCAAESQWVPKGRGVTNRMIPLKKVKNYQKE